jgi:hypothetical protein
VSWTRQTRLSRGSLATSTAGLGTIAARSDRIGELEGVSVQAINSSTSPRREGGSPDGDRAGIERLKTDGLIVMHDSEAFFRFTNKGAQRLAWRAPARLPYLPVAVGSNELAYVCLRKSRIRMAIPSTMIQEIPRQTCARCRGIGFFHTPILDPATSRMFHLFRCKTCENHQWSADGEDQAGS